MEDRFSTIVVPLDLKHDERAVAAAAALASVTPLPIRLVTVLPPGYATEPYRGMLHRVATEHGLDGCEYTVLHDHVPATAIARFVDDIESPLIVMTSAARGVLAEALSVSTGADLLSEVHCPVLVLGPHVDARWQPTKARMVVCVGPETAEESIIQPVLRWHNTFEGPTSLVVEVLPPKPDTLPPRDVTETAEVHHWANRLVTRGVESEWEVLHDHDAVEGIVRLSDGLENSVLVVSSERWSDPSHLHLRSLSRRLAHRASHPVLVAPRTMATVAGEWIADDSTGQPPLPRAIE